VYLLALTAVRYLGRNPIGSQTLLTTPHLPTLLHHSALPFPATVIPFSHPPPPPYSLPALEALKVLANLLVLHAAGRNRFANAGGARAVSLALGGSDAEGEDVVTPAWSSTEEGVERERERVFLLARLGFLVTVERKAAVEVMVNKEGLLDSLVYVSHLCRN
jgi:hypothetical protein